jgi:hypothetical protein
VTSRRTAEKYAVTLDETMEHAPLKNLIFNRYNNLKKTLPESAKILKKMGAPAYRNLIMDCINNDKDPDPGTDHRLMATQTLQDVISITVSARKALGKARLATATKGTEFMRVIVGNEGSQIAAGGGYYCQTCWTQPKYDYHWTLARKYGNKLSGWFCGANGCPYDSKRMPVAIGSIPVSALCLTSVVAIGSVPATLVKECLRLSIIAKWYADVTKWNTEIPNWSVGEWSADVAKWGAGVSNWNAGVAKWSAGVDKWSAGVPNWSAGVPKGNQKGAKGSQNGAKREPKGSQNQHKST